MKYGYLTLLITALAAAQLAAANPTPDGSAFGPTSPISTSSPPGGVQNKPNAAPAIPYGVNVYVPAPVVIKPAPIVSELKPGETSAAVPSFTGVYRCHGYDPYLNQNYTGTVTVTQQNTVYRLEMVYDTGEKSLGTGGLYDKYLMSVVFQDSTDPKHIGLEQYHFTDDYKTMSGYWVYLGKDKLGKEICDKQ